MKRSHYAAAAAALTLPLPAPAFTFSDGTTLTCMAQGEPVAEVYASPDDPAMKDRVGRVTRVGDRWQITWNEARLKALPPVLRDFLFFHECAHARLATDNELLANCAGLKDMRAAGRAGPAVEARIRAMFGPANAFWAETFACADRGDPTPPAAKPVG